MCSLVAAYSDSESDSGTEVDGSDLHSQTVTSANKTNTLSEPSRTLNTKSGVQDNVGVSSIIDDDDDHVGFGVMCSMLTSSQEGEDSESDEEDSDEIEEAEDANKQPERKVPLANPFRQFSNATEKHESVFEIPFLDQEIKKSAALERHVKMTQAAGTQEMINGKKICWNYRKGRCRFGHNCTFAHDSDIQQAVQKESTKIKVTTPFFNAVEPSGSNEPYDETAFVISSPHLGHCGMYQPKQGNGSVPTHDSPEKNDGVGKKGKKRRPGLSQTLTPSKKVMKMYSQSQSLKPS